MYHIKPDHDRNLLQLTLAEELSVAEAAELLAEVTSGVEQLTEGFTVLTDLRHLKDMEEGAVLLISRVMEQCNAKGVARVVRVIPVPCNNFGFHIMSHFAYDEEQVQIITCETLEEAVTCSRQRSLSTGLS